MRISRIIHQTAPDFASLPAEIRDSIGQLRARNPGWEYRFYDHAAALSYIGEHLGGDALRLCERVDPRFGVIVADLLRYVAVHREGGVYLDVKSTVLKPLEEVLLPEDVFVLSQWRNRIGEKYAGWGAVEELPRVPGGEFQQWHVIGAAGHPFLEQVIADTLRNMRQYHPGGFGNGKQAVVRVSGPVCYTLAIARLLPFYRARIVDAESLGIVYTIYPDRAGHMRTPGHYSKLREPIMRSEPDDVVPEMFLKPGLIADRG